MYHRFNCGLFLSLSLSLKREIGTGIGFIAIGGLHSVSNADMFNFDAEIKGGRGRANKCDAFDERFLRYERIMNITLKHFMRITLRASRISYTRGD